MPLLCRPFGGGDISRRHSCYTIFIVHSADYKPLFLRLSKLRAGVMKAS